MYANRINLEIFLSKQPTDSLSLLKQLNTLGVALSQEEDHVLLLEMFTVGAKELTHADGSTLYLCHEDDNKMHFEIVHTDSLNLHLGGKQGEPVNFAPITLYYEDGTENLQNVVACAAVKKKTFNIHDAYTNDDFDFSGTRFFDAKTGYHSKSFLTVPMYNHEHALVGVLQLINAHDPETGAISTFSELDQQIVESLASQVAITLTNKQLIEAQKELFESFLQLIANAIDEKSPYTAGHCRRVPVLTNMLAQATCEIAHGPLRSFCMTEQEMYALNIAGWLHDCGKITTPGHVVDKSTKLETIYDRIATIDTRFEVLKRDAVITALKQQLNVSAEDELEVDQKLDTTLEQLDNDRAFIHQCNIGAESMSDLSQQRIKKIAEYQWQGITGEKTAFLSDDEVYNLSVYKGTLNQEERNIVNHHIVVTINMLESLPYPKKLRNVVEYAGGHHEKMDGTGYPKGLTKDEMSIPARMMAIADIFEALTAADRPYKKAMALSQALTILGKMKLNNHIDADLFDVFIWQKIYLKYAHEFLAPEQCDDFSLQDIPGYVAPEGSEPAMHGV
ncbi:Chemotactic transducer-related protein [uncultured Candidatus Thioglobus sp.]|nr:Chemotactic transducer-related protein [uncultured Candidatus Thioglobus sp.]